MITTNPDRTDTLIYDLTTFWEASVRATHHFLIEDDIQKLIPFVKKGISDINTLVVAYDNDKPVAFMGIDSAKIEMLFVSPDYFGKGIGSGLATWAIRQFDVKYVDVNEQNPQAAGFYRHIGFEVFDRTESDEQGNPFPILKMRLKSYSIRQANEKDITALHDLFKNTVLCINLRDYSQAEVEDWASCCNNEQKWKQITEDQYFIVAENQQSEIVGFSSITPLGYLHFMFVHKDFQNKGIASMLLKEIEKYAEKNEINEITSEVSLTARSFFERHGYQVLAEQKRKANQLYLTNFQMAKQI